MNLLIYEGKVAVVLLVFYLFFRFLLKKETFHRFNRWVLVGTAVLSFVLPLCVITIHKQVEMVPEISVSKDILTIVESSEPWWPMALAILFWAGVAFVLVRVAVSIISIMRIIRKSELVQECDGCKVVVTKSDTEPFSWMRHIVLSKTDWESNHASILIHEKAHVKSGHSIELLLVDILSAYQWFNPAIWMLRSDLKELQEYEADDFVLRNGIDIKEYQYLLLRKAVSKSGYSVANSFNHSILKNRINMMTKTKSPLSRGWRVLYMLPLMCLCIGLQAQTVIDPIASNDPHEQVVVFNTIPTLEDVDVQPTFNGGPVMREFTKWVSQNIQYPESAFKSGLGGMVTVSVLIQSNGDINSSFTRIKEGVSEELDNEVLRVVKSAPAFTPAKKDGKETPVQFELPIAFAIRSRANNK